ncbi:MAG: amidohydrolase [Pseudomonadota bacterium]
MADIHIANLDGVLLPGGNWLRDAHIIISGTRLRSIDTRAPEPSESATTLDGRGCIAVPGLYNAHCHAAMTLVRGWAEDLPFDRWLNEKIWIAESALTEEDVYWGAALAACEMVRAGVVGFADHYFWMNQVARVVEESGLRALLAWCHFGLGPEREVGGTSLDDLADFARRWHGAANGRVRVAMGPHSPYMCPPAMLRRLVDLAQDLGIGMHLHLAESAQQVRVSLDKHGRSPVAHVEAQGVFDVPCLAAHCIAVDDADVAILARRGVSVAHTPKTYMKLAMGTTPVMRLLDAGVRLALGSDGPGSNSDLNLLEILRLVGLQQKHLAGDASCLPVQQILNMASAAGAAALGFEGAVGLSLGAPADLVLVETRGPHWYPRHDLLAGLVYTSHPSDVRDVIVDGRILMRDRQLLTLDEDRIRHEAERRAFRMVGTDMARVREYQG